MGLKAQVKTSIIACIAFLVCAFELQAQSSTVPGHDPPSEASVKRPGSGWQSVMDTRRWREEVFRDAYADIVDALSNSHGESIPKEELNFAELMLSQMFLVEAGSVAEAVEPANDIQAQRKKSLLDAASVLMGQPIEDLSRSPLAATDRPDRGLWLALHAIATEDADMLGRYIEPAFQGLSRQSPQVVQSVLPVLTEAAIELGNTALADSATALLRELPEVYASPVGHFLRGRNAELQGNLATALKSYLEAARGWERYAARARIALADMAIRDGGRGALLAARNVLTDGSDAWRGDRYELQVLMRHASISRQLGDDLESLLLLAKVMSRFPNEPEIASARHEAEALLEAVYMSGAAGEIRLSQWMEVHLLILPFLEHMPEFAEYNEVLADSVFELGGTVLAATEYRRTLALLGAAAGKKETGSLTPDIVRVKLKLIKALSHAGLDDLALEEVDAIELSNLAEFRNDVLAAKAEVLAKVGDRDRLLTTPVMNPGPTHLREIAYALFTRQRWEEAVNFYKRLRSDYPSAFSARDASYLLIAANRIGDTGTVHDVTRDFRELTESQEWADLAASLADAPIEMKPLAADNADAQMLRLQQTLKNLEDSGL